MQNKVIAYPIADMFRNAMYHTTKDVGCEKIDMFKECMAVIPMIRCHVREAEDSRRFVHFKEEAIHINAVRHMCELFLSSVEVLRTDEKMSAYNYAEMEALNMIKQTHKNSALHDILSDFFVKCTVRFYRLTDKTIL